MKADRGKKGWARHGCATLVARRQQLQNLVCRLHIRQSAQRFLNMLDTWLGAYGFRISMGDQCLHILYNEAKDEEGIPATFIFLSSHIDDLYKL